MISLIYSLQTTVNKIRIKIWRHLFAVLGIAISMTLLISFVFISQVAIELGKSIFPNSIQDKFYALKGVKQTGDKTTDAATFVESQQTSVTLKSVAFQYVFPKSKFGISSLVEAREFSLLKIRTIDPQFAQDFVWKGQTLTQKNNDGRIPIIVPARFIIEKENEHIDQLASKDKFDYTNRTLKKYIGRQIDLVTKEDSDKNNSDNAIKTYIAGFSRQSVFSTQDLFLTTEALLIPEWAIEQDDRAKQLLNDQYFVNAIIEFRSKADRAQFLEEQNANFSNYNADELKLANDDLSDGPILPIDNRFESFTQIIQYISKAAYGVGAGILIASALIMMTTIGKSIADSSKEIAMYRAVGAKKTDIYSLVMLHGLILYHVGFAIAGLISTKIAFSVWDQAKTGFFYSIANLSSKTEFEIPTQISHALPWSTFLLLYASGLMLTVLTTLIPAWRASKIDPAQVLKEE